MEVKVGGGSDGDGGDGDGGDCGVVTLEVKFR